MGLHSNPLYVFGRDISATSASTLQCQMVHSPDPARAVHPPELDIQPTLFSDGG